MSLKPLTWLNLSMPNSTATQAFRNLSLFWSKQQHNVKYLGSSQKHNKTYPPPNQMFSLILSVIFSNSIHAPHVRQPLLQRSSLLSTSIRSASVKGMGASQVSLLAIGTWIRTPLG